MTPRNDASGRAVAQTLPSSPGRVLKPASIALQSPASLPLPFSFSLRSCACVPRQSPQGFWPFSSASRWSVQPQQSAVAAAVPPHSAAVAGGRQKPQRPTELPPQERPWKAVAGAGAGGASGRQASAGEEEHRLGASLQMTQTLRLARLRQATLAGGRRCEGACASVIAWSQCPLGCGKSAPWGHLGVRDRPLARGAHGGARR